MDEIYIYYADSENIEYRYKSETNFKLFKIRDLDDNVINSIKFKCEKYIYNSFYNTIYKAIINEKNRRMINKIKHLKEKICLHYQNN